MRLKHDLRAELGIIAARAADLQKALMALPETEAEMEDALDELAPAERVQAAEYVRQLAQRAYMIRQQALWVVQRLQESL